MEIKAKFNRGPMNGERSVVDNDIILVQRPHPKKNQEMSREVNLRERFLVQTGTYQKSNVQLKDGTWVFEWMGWYADVED